MVRSERPVKAIFLEVYTELRYDYGVIITRETILDIINKNLDKPGITGVIY